MSRPVRAALVGFDNPHSHGWLQTLRHCPAIGEVALCGAGAPAGAEEVYADVDALLDSGELGFALVCTRNDCAPALIGKLLAAGVPLIAEKPVARSAAEIGEIDALARKVQVPWATAFVNRYHPAVRKMRALVQEGVLGRLLSVEGRMVTSAVAQRDPGHWLFSRALAGGGILHWLAIHTIDLVRFISGQEYASVCAQVATLVEDIDVEEVASVSFALADGAVGSLHAGYVLPRRYGDVALSFRGTRGDMTWHNWNYAGRCDLVQVQSQVGELGGEAYREWRLPAAEGPGYGGRLGIDFVADFCAAAAGGTPFVTSGGDALCAMRFVEAAYAAAESGRRIELERA